MSATMTITITEDDSPDGVVGVDFDVQGFDIETARVNSDLPASLLLGARMLQMVEEELPEIDGPPGSRRPAPSKHANLPTRHRH